MNDRSKAIIVRMAKDAWRQRCLEKAYPTRWTQPDEKKEPTRQREPGEKAPKIKEPMYQRMGVWVFVTAAQNLIREIVTVEKMVEKAFEEWLVAFENDISQKDFSRDFRLKYEGVRSEDIEFLVRIFESWVKRKDKNPRNPNLEKEKETEQVTAPMNPILLGGKVKDEVTTPEQPGPTASSRPKSPSPPPSPSISPIIPKRKGHDDLPVPRKRTKLAQPEPESEPEEDDDDDDEDDDEEDEDEDDAEEGPLPPDDSEDENDDSVRVIKPWHKKQSDKGGIIWEKTVETTSANGKKQLEKKADHKDESISHLKKATGSWRFPKYNRFGTTNSGGR